jgi:hypothetical protein
MKTLKIILASTLLLSVSSMAMSSKIKEENKTIYTVLEGNSMNVMSKPGLAVDLDYKSEHVAVGAVSNVNITLITELNSGTLKVNIKALDEGLIGLEEQNLEFELSESLNRFPINLKVGSALDGIHYINLVLSVEGQGSRVLVVPVNIGTISSKVTNKAIERTDKGIAISVSPAEEEIK